jgi:hypothetical protein
MESYQQSHICLYDNKLTALLASHRSKGICVLGELNSQSLGGHISRMCIAWSTPVGQTRVCLEGAAMHEKYSKETQIYDHDALGFFKYQREQTPGGTAKGRTWSARDKSLGPSCPGNSGPQDQSQLLPGQALCRNLLTSLQF